MTRVLQRIPGASFLFKLAFRHQTREKFGNKAALDGVAVVILMPGSVHIGLLALQYLNGYEKVMCIANGLTAQEVAFVEKNTKFPVIKFVVTLSHSDVIDIVIAELEYPFWLVDHDCYVLDTNILANERVNMRSSDAGVAIYSTLNRTNGVVVPETFLLLLNPAVIRALFKKYNVSSRRIKWRNLSRPARNAMLKLGLNETNMPEAHKAYFDTLRAVAFLAQAEGKGFVMNRGYSLMCRFYPEAIHIGNTSFPKWPPEGRYDALGVYFWRRCLEEPRFGAFVDRYNGLCPTPPRTSREIRQYLLQSGLMWKGDIPKFLDRLDALISKYSN